jgi:hypothetical protein
MFYDKKMDIFIIIFNFNCHDAYLSYPCRDFMLSSLYSNIFIGYREAKFSFFQSLQISGLKIPFLIILAPLLGMYGIFGAWGISLVFATIISMFF